MTEAPSRTETNCFVDANIAFALYPDGHVKRLAQRLVGLDLLGAVVFAERLNELFGREVVNELSKAIANTKTRGKL